MFLEWKYEQNTKANFYPQINTQTFPSPEQTSHRTKTISFSGKKTWPQNIYQIVVSERVKKIREKWNDNVLCINVHQVNQVLYLSILN